MENFTFKCNKCGSLEVDISVTSYHEHQYGLMATCNKCGNKEQIIED